MTDEGNVQIIQSDSDDCDLVINTITKDGFAQIEQINDSELSSNLFEAIKTFTNTYNNP
ncbi:hypothetical protein ACFOG5_09750 [Pedobacter fastidiosus]|uniref:hypothetical protein n=1 Tax=Pedobacter fastidiosus TaxID=2765361 RepID=UPI00164D528E